MKRLFEMLLLNRHFADLWRGLWLRKRARQIGGEVAADLRADVLRKIPSSSSSEFAHYVHLRTYQEVHARVDRLLQAEVKHQANYGQRLILRATKRACDILNQAYPKRTRGRRARAA